MTPHIQAQKTDFAPVVLMPGDPLRAKWIADTFLKDAVQINSVRNMLGYTGYYNQTRVSVLGHGMGNPSIGIYSHELFNPKLYDVKTIIRVGSCGSLVKDLNVGDVVVGTESFSESCYAAVLQVPVANGVLPADPALVAMARTVAAEKQIKPVFARCYSSDVFYTPEPYAQTAARTQACAVEMEAFALYANARLFSKRALCLLTVSDSLVTHEALSAAQRQTTFKTMVQLALAMCEQLDR